MRKGVFIPDITVEMFKNSTLESVEEFMTSGQMEDIEIPSWIPVKVRKMTDEEIKEFEYRIGEQLPKDEYDCFDCSMPEDDQEILVCTNIGHIYLDRCEIDPDYGYGLEENGDWDGIVAWMPLPAPYKKEGEQ